MAEKYGLEGIWEDLNKNLIVRVETYEDISSRTDLPLVTKFIVTNGSPKSDSKPDILFKEVVITVGIPPDLHIERHKELASGESFTCEYRSRYSDLANIVFSVDGTVSPEGLFRVKRGTSNIPVSIPSLSITSYVEVLKDLNIHRWLKDIIQKMLIPGPDTTKAEIKAQQDKLGNAMQEIRNTRVELEKIFKFIMISDKEGQQMRDRLSEHRKLVENYLERTERECSGLRKILDVLNTKIITSNYDYIVASLSRDASQVNQSTEALLLEQ